MSTFYIKPSLRKEAEILNDLIHDETTLLGNFFNDAFNRFDYHRNRYLDQTVIDETDDVITLNVDLPGFTKSEISIDYKDNQLEIKAKSADSKRKEVTRNYAIKNIDIEKSAADLKNGVLKLTLEKVSESKKKTLKIT